MEKRYLWSRARALVLDILLAWIVFGLVVTVAHYTISSRIIPSDILYFHQCQEAQLVSPERMIELLPLREGEGHLQQVCDIYPLFITHYRIGKLIRYKIEGNHVISNGLSYNVDDAGNETTLFDTTPIFEILLPFLLAIWAWFLGVTPGKRLIDLCVINEDGGRPRFKQLVVRECGRFLPLMIFGLYSLFETLFLSSPDLNTYAQMLADTSQEEAKDISSGLAENGVLYVVFSIVALWYWFGSFLRWKGKTYWDRFAGTKVVLGPSYSDR